MVIRRRDFCLGLAAAPALAWSARAQSAYPVRPVRLVIPFPPGGGNDIVGRMIGQQLSARLGQQVVIENRGGAGAIIGTLEVAKSPADGYSILLISAAYAFNPSLYKKLPYDPVNSFTPVASVGIGPIAVIAHPGLPANTAAELIALAKQKPGHIKYASAGSGSAGHLATEFFRLQAGIDLLHVPYKGGGPALTDVVAGHADIMMTSVIQALPLIKNSSVKCLATTGPSRTSVLPDIQTVAETLPGFEAANWWGILVPAGTPQPIVDRLGKELNEILDTEETRRRLATEGAEVRKMTPDEFGKYIQSETEKWRKVIQEARIQAE